MLPGWRLGDPSSWHTPRGIRHWTPSIQTQEIKSPPADAQRSKRSRHYTCSPTVHTTDGCFLKIRSKGLVSSTHLWAFCHAEKIPKSSPSKGMLGDAAACFFSPSPSGKLPGVHPVPATQPFSHTWDTAFLLLGCCSPQPDSACPLRITLKPAPARASSAAKLTVVASLLLHTTSHNLHVYSLAILPPQ